MNKVEMIIAGVAIIGVAGYVVAKTMKNSDTENKVESENTDNYITEDSKKEKLRERENILKQVQEQPRKLI